MSPRSKKQFEIIREKSKTAIMEVALELFATNGYHNTSISQISKAAGISKGLMYNYFESKEALLEAILFGAVTESTAVFDASMMQNFTPKERLRLLIEGTFAMVEHDFHRWKLLTMLAFQKAVYETLRAKLEHIREDGLVRFTQIFEEMGYEKPKLEAFVAASILDGVMLQYMNLEDNYPLLEMKQYLIDRFCS